MLNDKHNNNHTFTVTGKQFIRLNEQNLKIQVSLKAKTADTVTINSKLLKLQCTISKSSLPNLNEPYDIVGLQAVII